MVARACASPTEEFTLMVTSPGARAWRVAVPGDAGSELMVARSELSALHVASGAEVPEGSVSINVIEPPTSKLSSSGVIYADCNENLMPGARVNCTGLLAPLAVVTITGPE